MTPIYLDTQEAVDAHNERAKVQREAVRAYDASAGNAAAGAVLDRLFPFAQLRPQGFAGGSGKWYEWHHDTLFGHPDDLPPFGMSVPASDRAAASAALTGGVGVWRRATALVAERYRCFPEVAVERYEPEIVAEAQALLDREGTKS